MRIARLPLLLLTLVLPAGQALADTLRFESGVRQNVMIELYTSEGCSSCPPAEAYLNAYAVHPQLWTRYLPLAFHVDYWDYLGWRDRYAAAEHGARQRE